MQHPDLAVQQLEYGVKKLGLRGMSVGTHVEGMELSDPKFHPIWAKCEELGILVFMHPVAYAPIRDALPRQWRAGQHHRQSARHHDRALAHDLRGHARSLSRSSSSAPPTAAAISASYGDRSDAGCASFPDRCKDVPLKKKPTEYLRQFYYDTIIFTPEALALSRLPGGCRPDHAGHRLSVPMGARGRDVDHVLNTPSLSDADKRAMLGGTAAKLLGIK